MVTHHTKLPYPDHTSWSKMVMDTDMRCGKLEEIIRIPSFELFRAALEAKMVLSCDHPKIHAANAGIIRLTSEMLKS